MTQHAPPGTNFHHMIPPDLAAVCPRCGELNRCGMADPSATAESCWCRGTPWSLSPSQWTALQHMAKPARCLCARCASELQTQAAHINVVPDEGSHG